MRLGARLACEISQQSKPESACIPFSMESYTCQKDCVERGAEGIRGCWKRSDSAVRQEPIGHDDELSEEPEELL